jgi:hypothetical protein
MRQTYRAVVVFGLGGLAAALAPNQGSAQEAVAKSKIVSVAVFKNGLALVQQEVQVPGAGTYQLDTAPEPVHGTFWVKSNCQVETTLKLVDVETPRPVGGFQEELAGQEVVIHLKDKATLTGTVLQAARNPAGFLVVKTASGASYINPGEIAYIEAKGAAKTPAITEKHQRSVLVLTVAKTDQKPAITLSYVAHGLSWAPSYRVEIADGKTLAIEMAAVVRNELANLDGAETRLMTGLPTIQFAEVISPLAPRQTLEKFLAGLKGEAGSAATAGDGRELYFTSIGKRSLKHGESLALSVAKANVAYERVVEWSVASDDAGSIAEETWDVLHFKNPFAFPMATAPALVLDQDQFRSQRTCSQARIGEGSSLRFARSQEMRTRGHEQEDPPKVAANKEVKPELVRVGLHEYRRATIHGEMTVTNQRPQASKIIVRRALMGKVLDTDGDPKVQPREEGLRAVNPTNEVVWTVSLAAGEARTVRYSYQSLILRTLPRFACSW